MEHEERINRISEPESGRTGLKDDESESEMRPKLNGLADTIHGWQHENQQLWSGFVPKTSDDPSGTGASALPEVSIATSPGPEGPSAAQSSRRAKNAAQHRANDTEFAFEIGGNLLTEVRRLQASLAEGDKVIQDFKEGRDDLERTIEGLKTALRQQKANADKHKEENWNLQVTLQDLRNQLSESQSNAQHRESKIKQQNKQLATLRETSDRHKNEAERLANTLNLKVKQETDIEHTTEGLKIALRQQKANADKHKEENWNLQMTLQDLRNRLSESQSDAQHRESKIKQQNKELATLRETSDRHKNEAERLANTLEDLKAKRETDIPQMNKVQGEPVNILSWLSVEMVVGLIVSSLLIGLVLFLLFLVTPTHRVCDPFSWPN